jgi:hypothetical protein
MASRVFAKFSFQRQTLMLVVPHNTGLQKPKKSRLYILSILTKTAPTNNIVRVDLCHMFSDFLHLLPHLSTMSMVDTPEADDKAQTACPNRY